MKTREYAVDWEKIPEEHLNEFTLTGWIAVNFLLDRVDRSPRTVWAYAKAVEYRFPEGETSLRLRTPERYPSTFPLAGFVLADIDRVAEDIKRSDPRGFQVALEEDDEFLALLNRHLSTEKREELVDHFTQAQYRYDKVSDRIQLLGRTPL